MTNYQGYFVRPAFSSSGGKDQLHVEQFYWLFRCSHICIYIAGTLDTNIEKGAFVRLLVFYIYHQFYMI